MEKIMITVIVIAGIAAVAINLMAMLLTIILSEDCAKTPHKVDLRLVQLTNVVNDISYRQYKIRSLYNDYEYYNYIEMVKKYGELFLNVEVCSISAVNSIVLVTINDREIHLLEERKKMIARDRK